MAVILGTLRVQLEMIRNDGGDLNTKSVLFLRLFLGNTAWNGDFKVDHEKIPMIIEVPRR